MMSIVSGSSLFLLFGLVSFERFLDFCLLLDLWGVAVWALGGGYVWNRSIFMFSVKGDVLKRGGGEGFLGQ